VKVFVYKIVDAFSVRGRGAVFVVDRRDLQTSIKVGDKIELRGNDPPVSTTIKAIESMHGPPPGRDVLGVMVSGEVSTETMKRNPEVWRIENSD
jgi:translation elongation factor EF-Tu-like GTPase